MSLSCEMALQAKANSSASLDFLAKLICGYHSKLLNVLKSNMAKRWKITIFFIGETSSFMVDFPRSCLVYG